MPKLTRGLTYSSPGLLVVPDRTEHPDGTLEYPAAVLARQTMVEAEDGEDVETILLRLRDQLAAVARRVTELERLNRP